MKTYDNYIYYIIFISNAFKYLKQNQIRSPCHMITGIFNVLK